MATEVNNDETLAIVENPSDKVSSDPNVNESKDGSIEANNEAATDVQKKMKRAERFGMPVKLSEEEKRNSRAERFGSVANSNGTGAVKGAEDQKRKARAERFGIPVDTVLDVEAKKKARLAKFAAPAKADNVEDDKRKARTLRFSQQSSNPVSNVNGTEKPEQITSVDGNAGGAA